MRRALLLLTFLLLLAGAGYLYAALLVPYQGFAGEGVFVEIPRGASKRTIARLLSEHGVVRSRVAFEALGRWRASQPLVAGEYRFTRPATGVEVFDTLAAGRVYVKELIVPEGLTMFDIAELAAGAGFMTRDAFLAAARDPALTRELIGDLAPEANSLEGFLFPAKYEFPRRIDAKEMTAAMVRRFRQVWNALPGAVDSRRGALQTVTLASLVERETPRSEERARVAGVFENRLRIGLPLQCDPTVVYALTLANRYSGRLRSADLQFPSPYNTYRNVGLPPGPIANPGEAALRAALEPQATDDLYFVANTQGGHFFGKTLREHNENVARYRRLLEQPGSPSAPGAPANRAGPERFR